MPNSIQVFLCKNSF